MNTSLHPERKGAAKWREFESRLRNTSRTSDAVLVPGFEEEPIKTEGDQTEVLNDKRLVEGQLGFGHAVQT